MIFISQMDIIHSQVPIYMIIIISCCFNISYAKKLKKKKIKAFAFNLLSFGFFFALFQYIFLLDCFCWRRKDRKIRAWEEMRKKRKKNPAWNNNSIPRYAFNLCQRRNFSYKCKYASAFYDDVVHLHSTST